MDTAADHADIGRALAHYQGAPGLVSVMYLQQQGARPTSATYQTTSDDLARAARDVVKADTADQPLGVYVRGTTVRDGTVGRGTSDDTVAWIAFRADLDLGKDGGPATWPELFAVYETANLPTPTYWQHSGGGYYPTWKLAEPVAHGAEPTQLAADIEAELRRAWVAAGYRAGVDSCRDAARVWRLVGSVHRKNPAAPITSRVGNISGEVHTLAELRARVPSVAASPRWDGRRTDPRRAEADAFERTYRASLEAVRERGRGDFRHTFFTAARNAHRMVAIGLRTRDELRADLLALVDLYWPNAGLNGDDIAHVDAALNNGLDRGEHAGANASPWELVDRGVGVLGVQQSHDHVQGTPAHSDESTNGVEGGITPEEAFEQSVQVELRRRAVRRAADEAERPARPSMDSLAIWDEDLESVPLPRMAVEELIPEWGVGWLGGPSGTYKSFVAVQLARALAHGVPALGNPEFAVDQARRVLYVAGEDSAGVAMRSRAARHRLGVKAGRELALYPRPIDLTSEHEVADMCAFVLRHEIEFIVVDTFRQSTLGLEENSNSEVGVILGRLIALRDEHEIGSLLLDHTNKTAQGLADLGGAGAKRANADYVLMIDLPGVTRDRDQQRTLRVAKLKNLPDGKTWPIKLEAVPAVTDAKGRASAVAVVGEVLPDAEAWIAAGLAWTDKRWALPADVEALTGRGAAAARDLARYMRVQAADSQGTGESRLEAIRALKAAAGRGGIGTYSDDTVLRHAWSILVKAERLSSVTNDPTSKSMWIMRVDDPRPPEAPDSGPDR